MSATCANEHHYIVGASKRARSGQRCRFGEWTLRTIRSRPIRYADCRCTWKSSAYSYNGEPDVCTRIPLLAGLGLTDLLLALEDVESPIPNRFPRLGRLGILEHDAVQRTVTLDRRARESAAWDEGAERATRAKRTWSLPRGLHSV